MVEAFFEALTNIFNPVVFGAIVGGTLVAILLGIIPGVNASFAIVVLLPFMYGLDPIICLCLLTTLSAVGVTGGSITAVLLGIPGDTSNVATIIDGYPMTQKGEGARGVGAALMASMSGGVLAVVFAFAMIPVVLPLIMQFRAPEMVMLIVMGLSFLSALTRGQVLKGVTSALLGMLISTIGLQSVSGIPRFTFGNTYLFDGIDIIVMVLGLFALPILAEFDLTEETVATPNMASAKVYRQMLGGIRDVYRHWWLHLRCAALGYLVGVIPGIGGETAIWVAYSHAKQSSKYPEKFGTGCVEGVIAPESANNAKSGGAMLTTLAFGIPGSGVMVLLLAAFLINGIQPGPKMLTEHTALSFTLLLTIALANVLAGIMCFAAVPVYDKIARIPSIYLFCVMVPIIFIAIYAYNGLFLNLLVLLIVGIVALSLKYFGYPLPPFMLAFILGRLFEYYLWHSLDLFGPLFFLSPISLLLFFITILFIFQDSLGRVLKVLLKRWRMS